MGAYISKGNKCSHALFQIRLFWRSRRSRQGYPWKASLLCRCNVFLLCCRLVLCEFRFLLLRAVAHLFSAVNKLFARVESKLIARFLRCYDLLSQYAWNLKSFDADYKISVLLWCFDISHCLIFIYNMRLISSFPVDIQFIEHFNREVYLMIFGNEHQKLFIALIMKSHQI